MDDAECRRAFVQKVIFSPPCLPLLFYWFRVTVPEVDKSDVWVGGHAVRSEGGSRKDWGGSVGTEPAPVGMGGRSYGCSA